MCIATTDEMRALLHAIELLGIEGAVRFVHREGSPWIEADVVRLDRTTRVQIGDELVEVAAVEARLALWRYTLDVYRIGDDGAVEDDPVWTPDADNEKGQ